MNDNKMSENKFVTHGKTKLVQGTILTPELGNLRLILVPSSEKGDASSDLYNLLSRKWKQARAELKGWYSNHINFKLGNIQSTAVQSDTWVVHCLFEDKDGKVNEKALASCVKKLADLAKFEKASIHVSVLSTNAVPTLPDLLTAECVNKGTSVYYYEEV